MKVVINRCFGGFGLSTAAYERLIELGVPCRAYVEQKCGPDGLFLPEPANDGEVIFDSRLTPEDELYGALRRLNDSPYWEYWTLGRGGRTHPLVVQVVEELGEKADGPHAELKVVEIPDDVEWEIDEYDGIEHIAETHRTWQ